MLANRLQSLPYDGSTFKFVGEKLSVVSGVTGAIPLTSLTSGIDTDLREGDICFTWFCVAALWTVTGVTTSGWTFIGTVQANDVYDRTMAMAYKIMGATPDTSMQFAGTGAGATDCGCFAFRGVDSTNPLDGVTPLFNTNLSGGGPNPPSITTNSRGALIVSAASGVTDETAPPNMSVLQYSGVSSVAQFSVVIAETFAPGAYNYAIWPDTNTDPDIGKVWTTFAIKPLTGYRKARIERI